MKDLYSYIIDEGVKDTINKLKSLFKKKEKYVYKTEDKRWEEVLLLYTNIRKTGNVQSFMDVHNLVHVYMNGSRKYEFTITDKRQYAAFLQGVLDYAYLNYTRKLNQDPFGEISCNTAYLRACKEYGYDEIKQPTDCGAVGLAVFGNYPYGWGFAERLDLHVSSHWLVSFKTAEPIN